MNPRSNLDLPHRISSLLRRRFGAFEKLWEQFPDNVFVIRCEADGRFIVEAINPALARLLGRDSEATRDLPLDALLPPEQFEAVSRHYRQCIALGQPMHYEETGGPPDAPPQHWHTLLVPAADAQGRVEYILGISRDISAQRRAEAWLRGANEALERRVAERTAELEYANACLTELATRDGLTGLYNRRHLFELAAHEFSRATRGNHPLSLLMMDLDHFKQVNDRHGHAAGDQVLRNLAELFQSVLRQSDVVGRYGGEEFLAVLPDTEADEAWQIAERLRLAAAACTHCHAGICTLSIGVAHYDPARDASLDSLLQRADLALLKAKSTGRNRVRVGD